MIVYKAKEIPIMNLDERIPVRKNEIIIIKQLDINSNVWIPSALTDFIKCYYLNASNNTKIKNAGILCGFINYINLQIELGEDKVFEELKSKGLFAIKHIHLAKYINYLSNKSEIRNSYNTIKIKESILLKFYDFIYLKGISSKEAKISKKVVSGLRKNSTNAFNTKRGQIVIISPFIDKAKYHIRYPDKTRKRCEQLKDMNDDVWKLFLEYAEENYINIALGIYFQIMGGLRMGEVVNLVMDSVKVDKHNDLILLDIEDRQNELFYSRGINTLKSQVKKNRINQPVFNFNSRLFEVWEVHKRILNGNKKYHNHRALFIDSKGEPMSGEVYIKEFYKLKKEFIGFIETKKPIIANELRVYSWGTHIGRHIYTNYLIKKGLINDSTGQSSSKMLMILRGDSSELSSSQYLDSKAVSEVVRNNLELISNISVKYNKGE
ncbi:site-specific integrase [Clostridium sp. YIM B02500]|uniref:site-specific integrase n=1 Tax=Clostridium sp. YIM B02500 TaxID=2910681 RepID=UPI001EEE005E|nr:site-specific integrase [Clostridium sp. YIM B02500]